MIEIISVKVLKRLKTLKKTKIILWYYGINGIFGYKNCTVIQINVH